MIDKIESLDGFVTKRWKIFKKILETALAWIIAITFLSGVFMAIYVLIRQLVILVKYQ